MKKHRQKMVVAILALLALAMVSGCAAMKKTACSPEAAAVDKAVILASQIAVLQPFFPPATAVGAALQAVLPNLLELKNGYCVSDQDNFLVYVQRLLQGAEKQAMTKGFKGFEDPEVQYKMMIRKMELWDSRK